VPAQRGDFYTDDTTGDGEGYIAEEFIATRGAYL
jgi:hypothetical protein